METVIILILLGLLGYEGYQNRKLARAALDILSRHVTGFGIDAETTAKKALDITKDLLRPDTAAEDATPEKLLEAMRRSMPVEGEPGYIAEDDPKAKQDEGAYPNQG